MYGLIKRLYTIFNPPKVEKESNALRFGVLGAAKIAPMALLLSARSHPEVEVTAVASRNEQKARAYAKKHGIQKVYYGPTGYQDLIADPNIDVIYNPLPNGLHYEWTAKALKAGKHVLLEKPSTDSSEETSKLFELAASKGLVLLEAFHYKFHPAFHRLEEIIQSGELGKVKTVKSELAVPSGFFPRNDVRFEFDLGGGSLMDMGVYTISAIRAIASAEPTSVPTASHSAHRDPRVDRGARATFTLPNDITAELACDMEMPWYMGVLPPKPLVHVTVQLEGGEVSLYNFVSAHLFHSLTVSPRNGTKRVEKVYKPADGKGEEWWTSYRYQLEAFVDKVRGRTPHTWISGDHSVAQLRAVEMVYEKLGLPIRPKSDYVA